MDVKINLIPLSEKIMEILKEPKQLNIRQIRIALYKQGIFYCDSVLTKAIDILILNDLVNVLEIRKNIKVNRFYILKEGNMVKECEHKDKFNIEKNWLVMGWKRNFLQAVSFSMCANCGQMSDLEENIIKDKKREVI